MKISTAARSVLAILAAAAILAGCGGGAQSAFAPTSGTPIGGTASKGLKACDFLSGSGGTAQDVGLCHTIVMQTVIENYQAILSEAGTENPTVLQFLEAMLNTPGISAGMKAVVQEIVNWDEGSHGSYGPYCGADLSYFENGLDAVVSNPHANFKNVLTYLADEESKYPSCDGFSNGMDVGKYIVLDGKSTIYNPKWLKSHGDGVGSGSDRRRAAVTPDFLSLLAKVLIGDIVGGVTGGLSGDSGWSWRGAACGAVAGSIGALL